MHVMKNFLQVLKNTFIKPVEVQKNSSKYIDTNKVADILKSDADCEKKLSKFENLEDILSLIDWDDHGVLKRMESLENLYKIIETDRSKIKNEELKKSYQRLYDKLPKIFNEITLYIHYIKDIKPSIVLEIDNAKNDTSLVSQFERDLALWVVGRKYQHIIDKMNRFISELSNINDNNLFDALSRVKKLDEWVDKWTVIKILVKTYFYGQGLVNEEMSYIDTSKLSKEKLELLIKDGEFGDGSGNYYCKTKLLYVLKN